MRISANLGFLFRDKPLPDAIREAKRRGFDAVEMHWPYDVDPRSVADALAETGLPLLGINTSRGDVEAGDFGLSALPGREGDARAAIEQAVDWAERTGCRNIHVMAGKASGTKARSAFVENLAYAAETASPRGIGLLLEPINQRDAPGYFLSDIATALQIVEDTGGAARIMFDCYHMQIIQGDLIETIAQNLSVIGHIQFAAVPNRAEPDQGEVDYAWLLPAIQETPYDGFYGAEYRPISGTFDWLAKLRARQPYGS